MEMPITRAVDTSEIEMVDAITPLRRSRVLASRESVGNRSVNSSLSDYRFRQYTSSGSKCDNCMTRVPYATLIATIMCIIGVAVFCGTMHRGAALSVLLLDHVFHLRLSWLGPVQTTFIVIGGCMGALSLMILFVGFLATGATRVKVYRAWGARVGGRISCAVFMCLTYILTLAWLVMFIFLIVVTVFYTVSWALCSSDRVQSQHQGIDFKQFDFLFPAGTRPEEMEISPENEIKLFCKDYVEKAEVMFILATFACMLIILSLVHFLICLSANYAHIRDHEKLQELQDLQYLNDQDLGASKDRF